LSNSKCLDHDVFVSVRVVQIMFVGNNFPDFTLYYNICICLTPIYGFWFPYATLCFGFSRVLLWFQSSFYADDMQSLQKINCLTAIDFLHATPKRASKFKLWKLCGKSVSKLHRYPTQQRPTNQAAKHFICCTA